MYVVSFCFSALLAIGAALAHADSVPIASRPEKVSSWAWEGTAGDARIELLLVMAEQADLSPAQRLSSKEARGRWVYETLWEQAQRSQEPLRRWLDGRGVPYRSYYIVNLIHVLEADRALLDALAVGRRLPGSRTTQGSGTPASHLGSRSGYKAYHGDRVEHSAGERR